MIAVLGQSVTGPNGKEIGRLTDVLVNAAGVPEAAVIDFGGFMGVGSRTIAVHWSTLRFHPGAAQNRISITLLPAEIGAAPQYKGTQRPAPVVVAHPSSPVSAPGSAPMPAPAPTPAPAPAPAPAPTPGAPVQGTPGPAPPRPGVAAATAPTAAPPAPTVPQVATPIPFDAPATTLSTNPQADPLAIPQAAPLAAPGAVPGVVPGAAPLAAPPAAAPSGATTAPR